MDGGPALVPEVETRRTFYSTAELTGGWDTPTTVASGPTSSRSVTWKESGSLSLGLVGQ